MHPRKLAACAACFIGSLLATVWIAAQTPASQTGGGSGAQAPGGRGGGGRGPAGANLRTQERDLLYVASPGTADSQNGPGILVFDVRKNFKFVKRIPTVDYPAWQDPANDEVKGIAANAATGRLYLGTLTGLTAIDLVTEKIAYRREMPEGCCDRLAISTDGKTLYVPELGAIRAQGVGKDGWLVMDADTGKTVKKIATEFTHGSHNTIFSPDGSRVFLAALNSRYVTVLSTKDNSVEKIVGEFGTPKELAYAGGPGANMIRPFTSNGKGSLIFVNVQGLLGFEVGDVTTGRVTHHVEVPGYPAWTRADIHGEGTASHGIAMTPDEKEIWVTDNIRGMLHVFDATVMPPKMVTSISLNPRRGPGEPEMLGYPYWVSFGLDGKYAYTSTGDVVDTQTKRLVTYLVDEFGRNMRSEKIVEVLWQNGKTIRNSDQFGTGLVK